jgi:hypothetical protein
VKNSCNVSAELAMHSAVTLFKIEASLHVCLMAAANELQISPVE